LLKFSIKIYAFAFIIVWKRSFLNFNYYRPLILPALFIKKFGCTQGEIEMGNISGR